jgi:hypothetical protein
MNKPPMDPPVPAGLNKAGSTKSAVAKETPVFGFVNVVPNQFQYEFQRVYCLRNSHLPFVAAAMPRPFLWQDGVYALDDVVLPNPEEWSKQLAAEGNDEVVEEFVTFEMASPVKKSKA